MLKRNTPPDTKTRPKPKKEMRNLPTIHFQEKGEFLGAYMFITSTKTRSVSTKKKYAQPAQDQRNLVQQLAAKTRRPPAVRTAKRHATDDALSYSGTLLPSASGLGEDPKNIHGKLNIPRVTTGILGEETDAYIRFP